MITHGQSQCIVPYESISPYFSFLQRRIPYPENVGGPLVRAATELGVNSATEIVTVENIQQSNDSFLQLVSNNFYLLSFISYSFRTNLQKELTFLMIL